MPIFLNTMTGFFIKEFVKIVQIKLYFNTDYHFLNYFIRNPFSQPSIIHYQL
jgi:hypothetical protein